MEKRPLTQEKANRIAVGATVGGVLLVFFLLIVLIILCVQVAVRGSEKARLQESIEQYQASIERDDKVLDDYLCCNGLYRLAVMQGWKSR